MVTLFYDGHCPLCMKEIALLQRYNTEQRLKLVDIHSEVFDTLYPQIDKQAADRLLHAIDHNGQLLTGLDANVAVWQAVGKHKWLTVLRWPVIRWFADRGYLLFAKHRHKISFWLTGQKRCDACEKDVCPPRDLK
ncbi:thiol-disulfide oxidoreductase DCC family protein [Marinomonas fungiae]|uniref:thiol-disulfide oxidoreductase DCC family protein n=1 Tax=Marinomonas fungiae TaxID=1137284 RepID=UPI003A8CD3AD